MSEIQHAVGAERSTASLSSFNCPPHPSLPCLPRPKKLQEKNPNSVLWLLNPSMEAKRPVGRREVCHERRALWEMWSRESSLNGAGEISLGTTASLGWLCKSMNQGISESVTEPAEQSCALNSSSKEAAVSVAV